MAVTWFLAPYKRQDKVINGVLIFRGRYCAMDDFTALILADGGMWSETEVLGNHALVKVRASAATLTTIAAAQGIRRLPKDALDDPLSSLTNAQRTALRDLIESLGYPRAEWQAALGTNLGLRTLREVLQFIRRRRLKPRYDAGSNTIVLDGAVQQTRTLESVDLAVTAG